MDSEQVLVERSALERVILAAYSPPHPSMCRACNVDSDHHPFHHPDCPVPTLQAALKAALEADHA